MALKETKLSITASHIASALRGYKTGDTWLAHCPAHKDGSPSLSIRVGERQPVIFHCHSGCDQKDVLDALKKLGIWEGKIPEGWTPAEKNREASQTIARRIWATCVEAGPVVDRWLRSRKLLFTHIPSAIRYHASMLHRSTQTRWPTMVAAVQDSDGMVRGLQRTYLDDGGRRKAPVDPERMSFGICKGNAVHLAKHNGELIIGEGIETSMAGMQCFGVPAWAALSAVNLANVKVPRDVHTVILLEDNDDAGHSACEKAKIRLEKQGKIVKIEAPSRGKDFNDLLMCRY